MDGLEAVRWVKEPSDDTSGRRLPSEQGRDEMGYSEFNQWLVLCNLPVSLDPHSFQSKG